MTEFSRMIATDKVAARPLREQVSATEPECAQLAQRLGLLEIRRFEAEVTLRRILPGQVIKVNGHIRAAVVQACVISLEPVCATVESDFEAFFEETTDKKRNFPDDEEQDTDIVEPVENGQVNIGELAAQSLSLALDPYPRAKNTALPPVDADKQALFEVKESPFAALSALRGAPPEK